MSAPLRVAQIGIAHTHATKTVVEEARILWQRLDVEFTGIHEPDRDPGPSHIYADRILGPHGTSSHITREWAKPLSGGATLSR